MTVSRRSFVRVLGAGGMGALVAPALAARGREALEAATPAEAAPAPAASSIRLDSNENPNGPGDAALEAVHGVFTEASRYPDRPEDMLQESIARANGLPVDRVLTGCGSTEILKMAVERFTSPGRGLVTAAPTFEAPAHFAARIGAPVAAVPLDAALRLDLAAMGAKAAGAGLVYLCNPNNPTATAHGSKAVKDLVSRVLRESPDTTILIDEAYFEYVEDPAYATAIPLAMEHPRVVVARTFSKVFGLAGLRVGWAAGDPATLEALKTRKLPSGVNLMGAAAAAATVGDAVHVERERRLNREAKTFTRRFFESAGYKVVNSEANFMMVDIRRDSRAFRAACRESSVMVGRPFPPLDTYARISIGTIDEMHRAVEVFRQVLAIS